MSSDPNETKTLQSVAAAIGACLTAYGGAAQDPDWRWHYPPPLAPVADRADSRGTAEPAGDTEYLLPLLEGLSLYLQVDGKEGVEPLDRYLGHDRLGRDVRLAVSLANEGFALDPYLKVDPVDRHFVETAARFLSVAALLSRTNSPALRGLKESPDYDSFLTDLTNAVRRALEVLSDSSDEGAVGETHWAATRTREHGTPRQDLRHTYFSLCAISGLADLLLKRGGEIPFVLTPVEEEKAKRLLVDGARGFLHLYDSKTGLYADNPSTRAGDLIPSFFAVEAILRAWQYVPDDLRDQARATLLSLASSIGRDGKGLDAFDKRAGLFYVARSKADFVNLLDDHTTIGTVTLVLALGLDALLITAITDDYYAALDESARALLERHDAKTKTWKEGENAIWYSYRAVDSLSAYLEKRPIRTAEVTIRELVGIVNNALASNQVVEAISAQVRKSLHKRS